MELERDIEEIRTAIKIGGFANEAAVSQGVVLRLLNSLGWPAYDTQTVSPQYGLEGRRVDYALCHPPGKPIAFIEVKNIGQGEDAERQLFEYAFHKGVQLAILTDGRDWNFSFRRNMVITPSAVSTSSILSNAISGNALSG